jgi:ABC-type multidrug transport system fused ATPase/permease subunit
MMNIRQIVKYIFAILNRKEKRKFWQLAIADIFISIFDILFLIGLLYIINFYTFTGKVTSTSSYKIYFESHPILLIVLFCISFAVKNAYGFLVSKGQFNFVYDVASRLSKDNLIRYLNGSYADFVTVDSSVMNRKISQQPIEFSHYVLNGAQQVLSQAMLIIITVIAIFIVNPLLLPLLVLILVPPLLLIVRVMKKKLDEGRLNEKRTGEKALQHLQEALSGYVESNIYGRNSFFTERYHRLQSQLNRYLSERLIIQSMPSRLIEVFAVFALLVLIIISNLTNNTLHLVTIGSLMVAAYKIIPGIVKITNVSGQMKTYSFTTLDLVENKGADINTSANIARLDEIHFDDVSFAYGDKTIFNNFSVKINSGDMAGVVGLSGRGKTTFINLLLGFLEATSGKISINGIEMKSNKRRKYWQRISYVRQQHFFIHAPLIQNITLDENKYDETKITRIVQKTGINNLISKLPDGIETIITENGKNFSGGERQRIQFARGLYKDADLLILDEPFNEMDEPSEHEMLHVLQEITGNGKIVILITHNRSALSFCNKKILIE